MSNFILFSVLISSKMPTIYYYHTSINLSLLCSIKQKNVLRSLMENIGKTLNIKALKEVFTDNY